MLKVVPLCSGSSGNAAYIGTSTNGILIDAGRNCKTILNALEVVGIEPAAIKAILVTHDHSDHISGLRVLAKKLRVPVYASEETLCGIESAGCIDSTTQLFELSAPSDIAGLGVTPFDTPHDVAHSLGFRIEAGERTIGFATDLGRVTTDILAGLTGCDLVLLEANYDEQLLSLSSYPYYLKQRIRSDRGHLSNADSAACVRCLALSGTGRFILGHLSRENNTQLLALQAAKMQLTECGLVEGRDYLLTAAQRLTPTQPMLL
ncbi:MAG: MBL fold metallo-hydrolase [Angelakisella sp.]